MKRYVDYLTSKAKDGIVDIRPERLGALQDHHPGAISPRPRTITKMPASWLGRRECSANNEADALKYAELAATIKEAFDREVLSPGYGPVWQRQPDLVELRALPGAGGRRTNRPLRTEQSRRQRGADE